MNKDTAHMRILPGTAAILFLCALLGYLFLFLQIHEKWQQVYDLRSRTFSGRVREDQVFQIERALHDHEKKVAELESYFLTEETVPQFIEKLETLAAFFDTPMHLSSLTTDTYGREGNLLVSMVIEGEYARISQFVRMIELLPLRIKMSSLALALATKASPGGSADLSAPELKKASAPLRWRAMLNFRVLSFHAKSALPERTN